MQLGDTIENAMWLDGRESKEQLNAYKNEVCRAMTETCTNEGFTHSEVMFHVEHPYDDRVPPVPEHINGTEARLLVGEAEITGEKLMASGSFIADLEENDLKTLRRITKQIYSKNGQTLNTLQADQAIEELGPETIYEMVSKRSLN